MAFRHSWARGLAVGSAMALAGAVHAQNAQQQAAIDNSLDGNRVRRTSDAAIDAATAGYYQVVVTPEQLVRDQLCPTSAAERDALKRAEQKVWNWALGKKRDWGAALRIVYDGRQPDWNNKAFQPNAWMRFFTARYDDSQPGDCGIPEIDQSPLYSPLIALSDSASDQVSIEFSTWYNKTADRARIEALTKGGGFLLGLAGAPIGLLATPAVSTRLNDEVLGALEKRRGSVVRDQLRPRGRPRGVVGYFGVRPPPAVPTGGEARATVMIHPVASIFAPTAADWSGLNLSGWSAADILQFRIPAPTAEAPNAARPLAGAITDRGSQLNDLAAATDDSAASAICKSLGDLLRDQLRLSATDTAIIQYAAIRNRANTAERLGRMRNIACVRDNAALLKSRAKIDVPTLVEPGPPGVPATRERMNDAMTAFATIARSAEPVSGLLWSAFAWPLRAYDSTGTFDWTEATIEFAADDRDRLRRTFAEKITNVGCWAYFPDPGASYAAGLGTTVPHARKSAALVRMADGRVVVAQFRYDGTPDAQRIDGIALTRNDPAAFALMRGNRSCTEDWMRPMLEGR